MNEQSSQGRGSAQILPVFFASDLHAVDGANLGDPITVCDELIIGDTYHLRPGSERLDLALQATDTGGAYRIDPDSGAGRPGALVHIDGLATLMTPDGATLELLILAEMARDDSSLAAVHVFPLDAMAERRDYTIVTLDRSRARIRFAETACVSFTRGTRITAAGGRQVPVEELRVGDRVLTRDNGVQTIRWTGHQTMRALGAFAPIRIRAGTLNNENDLVVSPNHRLFVYQRADRIGAGRAEIMVRAENLLNGETVTRTAGGFVDYHQMLFDRHEIVFAEGIAVETLRIDQQTRAALPHEMAEGRDDSRAPSIAVEIDRPLGYRAADILREASGG